MARNQAGHSEGMGRRAERVTDIAAKGACRRGGGLTAATNSRGGRGWKHSANTLIMHAFTQTHPQQGLVHSQQHSFGDKRDPGAPQMAARPGAGRAADFQR